MKIKNEYLLRVIIAGLAAYLYQRSVDAALHAAEAAGPGCVRHHQDPDDAARRNGCAGPPRRPLGDRLRGWPVDPKTVQEMLDTLTGLT
jgi:hypothetical protein